MEQIKGLLENIFYKQKVILFILSNPRKKDKDNPFKVNVNPIVIKKKLVYQFVYYVEKKVIHKNFSKQDAINEVMELLHNFKQAQFYTDVCDYQVLLNKKEEAKIIKNKPSKSIDKLNLSHNIEKNYIIREGQPCDFLMYLGVMNNDGKVLAPKYDKFKQINRFLEIIDDEIHNLDNNKIINIIDFGCGKSYLTFALYFYLNKIKGLDINIYGLDLKKDVIENCNKIAEELGYKKLKFFVGNIENFNTVDSVDMVVTLHACDIATDAALVKAYNWGAKLILSVPCCQHELFSQIKNDNMNAMLKHGIIKERMSSLITDSLRVNVLEILGYSTQILEFIDMEHTPKNLLIRAVKNKKAYSDKKTILEYKAFKKFWSINPYIEKALGEEFINKIGD